MKEHGKEPIPKWPGPPKDSDQKSLVPYGVSGQSNLNDHEEEVVE